jgi:hypothetical protein
MMVREKASVVPRRGLVTLTAEVSVFTEKTRLLVIGRQTIADRHFLSAAVHSLQVSAASPRVQGESDGAV